MRKISLPAFNTVSFNYSAEDVEAIGVTLAEGFQAVPMGSIGPQEWEELKVARENGNTLIWATICLEKRLDRVVCNYFFGPIVGPNEKRQLFENEVIQSSSFTFHFKKHLIHQISDELQVPNGKGRSKLQGGLKRIMGWRNAFAHGSMRLDAKRGVILSYYSGQNKKEYLNDEYWEKVELTFVECDELIKTLEKATGRD